MICAFFLGLKSRWRSHGPHCFDPQVVRMAAQRAALIVAVAAALDVIEKLESQASRDFASQASGRAASISRRAA